MSIVVERNLRGIDRPLQYDLVCSDDVEGRRVCTRHLLEGGRRRIAFVIGSPTNSHRDRLAGYLYALHAAGGLAVTSPRPGAARRRIPRWGS